MTAYRIPYFLFDLLDASLAFSTCSAWSVFTVCSNCVKVGTKLWMWRSHRTH